MTSKAAIPAHLAQRLTQQKALLAPGVYDAFSALIAEQAGFEALYLSGASIAYTRLGRSDIGLTTATEVAQTLAHITDRINIPVIVDADTGFGNALNTQRTVRDFERAGAAMIQIEDQTFPKRCGHLDGKGVVPVGEMQGKLRAALDARHDKNTLILARTDAVAVEGLEPALERAERWLPHLQQAMDDYGVTADQTVAGQMKNLIDPNNPYYQQWATNGAQDAAARGFTGNSSIRDSGILDAVMRGATRGSGLSVRRRDRQRRSCAAP